MNNEPGSSPSLPPDLTTIYNSLTDNNRRLFNKVFKFMWRYVNDRRLSSGVLFWGVDLSRRHLRLPSSDLAVLTYLYYISGKGVNIVRSDVLYNSGILPGISLDGFQMCLNRLKHKGYLTRHTSDPSLPYQSRSYSRQPVFIKLSAAGVKLIQTIDKDLYNLMLHTSLDDITGRNKKEP